ncbi:MAG TPA: phosphoadenylyl-sulfate reductase [Vitreimonas sp.]|uniref:phosphoadenylyl-sulfate reductase n=1 Tax=Vitreimonas sp. TaxID=3069702 RepID=UPI002D73796E|nr:phosphoadenylyl-sulfate reductase [Vitreimonas sp.]HYD86879.1 phosphoadenylyl-sulfate reductase [Vitreimonas sp.]
MSVLVELDPRGVTIKGEAAPRAAAPVSPANDGHGDVRKKIVPVVKAPAGPSVIAWEGGEYALMPDWRGESALLLQPADDPRALAGRIDAAALVAVDFPRIGDGRGYSQAVLLRRRLNYRGRLRAVGAVTADQIGAMARVGFDSFELREDQDPQTAVAALSAITVPYQNDASGAGALSAQSEANLRARVKLLERELGVIAAEHERPALASSLSAEDMVITDVIARLRLPVDVFTLDTGRLHEETVPLIARTEQRYGIAIEVHRPDEAAVAEYVAAHGANGFYEGVAQRKLCCAIRKVAPLARALEGRDAWITGQRREQGVTRAALPEREHDGVHNAAKYNPLAAWSWDDVKAYAERFDVPMSPLYARGYVSIGCEPCTKAIRPGEDPRSGRWWWESQDSKECGLHTNSTTQ